MATGNQLHPDTADRFNAETYGQPFFGVNNAQVLRGKDTRQRGLNANSNRRRGRGQTRQDPLPLNKDQNDAFAATQNQTAPIQQASLPRKKPGRISRVVETGRKIVARVVTPLISAFLEVLAGFCSIIQLVLGGLASLAFFVAAGLYTLSDEAELVAAVLAYAGMTPDNFLLIYFGGSILILVLNGIQLVIGTVIYKAGQAHPIGGKGATFKLASILIIIIASFIPLLQMIPLIWLWIIAVTINPR